MTFRKNFIVYEKSTTKIYINQCYNPRKKTKYFTIRRDDENGAARLLGVIKWCGAWRQYVHFPESYTMWSKDCQDKISEFLGIINKEHREKIKRENK